MPVGTTVHSTLLLGASGVGGRVLVPNPKVGPGHKQGLAGLARASKPNANGPPRAWDKQALREDTGRTQPSL